MASTTQQLIANAARLLDLRNDTRGAIVALEKALELASANQDWRSEAQASAFLGEVLVSAGRKEEALVRFERVVAIYLEAEDDAEQIDHEIRVAREFLAQAAGLE